MRTTTPMTGRCVAAAAGLALVVAVSALVLSAAHAQSADSTSNGGSTPGGEGAHALNYGGPGMAGNLPLTGPAYNDGSR